MSCPPNGDGADRFVLDAPDSVQSGESFALNIEAVDTNGNTVSDYNETVNLSVNTGSIDPMSVDLQSGSAEVQATLSNVSGGTDVEITASNQNITGSTTVTVQAAGDNQLEGDPNAPAADNIPDQQFEARAQDYSTDNPELSGVYVSFNTLMLSFTQGTTVSEANGLLSDIDAEIVGGLQGSSESDLEIAGQRGSGILFVRVPTETHQELEQVLNTLREDDRVAVVVQDALVEVPPQSRLPEESALGTERLPQPNGGTPSGWVWDAQPTGGNYGMELSRVPQMWNLNASVEKQGGSAVTGVFDVGFENEANHDDLDYDQNLSPNDIHYHGTHVSGIINAIYDNGVGVDGVNPYADLVVRSVNINTTGDSTVFEVRESFGEGFLRGYFDLINQRSDIRTLNISLGYNWGPAGIDQDSNTAAQRLVRNQAALFAIVEILIIIFDNDYDSLDDFPLISVAAGNDSSSGFGIQDARWSSPFTYAGIVYNLSNVIVVESLANAPTMTGGATRSGFSNTGGDISAPGSDVLSTITNSRYFELSGTSMAAPHVTGLISYLYSVDSSLSQSDIFDLLTSNAVAIDGNGGNASDRIDAFASVIDIDRINGNSAVLRRLLDIDDGTPDGNQRLQRPGQSGTFLDEDFDSDGGIGDGNVDMSDFRRWRDWILQVEDPTGLSLSGSSTHPKKDVNSNDQVGTPSEENLYPRGDFNGDGELSRTATRYVPGAVNATVTDLDVLEQEFSDPNYSASDLAGLIDSADLEVWPETCFTDSTTVRVESSIRPDFANTPTQSRTHTPSDPRAVYTAPVRGVEGANIDYVARATGFDANNTQVFEETQTYPFDLGSDAFWDPCAEPQQPEGEDGESWGDPHLVSFDGLKYDFQAAGEFVFVIDSSGDLEVQARQEPTGNRPVSINTAVATLVDASNPATRSGFYADETPPLRVDGSPQSLSDGATLALGSGQIARQGNTYTVTYPSGAQLEVNLNGNHINLNVRLTTAQSGQVSGLLGDADGSRSNDLTERGGTVLAQPVDFYQLYGSYADSWRITQSTSLFDYDTGEDTSTFTDRSFPARAIGTGDLDPSVRNNAETTCRNAGVSDPIVLDACILDVGLTGDNAYAQSSARAAAPNEEISLAFPDLVIDSGSLSYTGTCEPNQTVVEATVTVRNAGNALSPARPNVGIVQALNVQRGLGWSNGTGLSELSPGQSETVTVEVFYLQDDPAFMEGEKQFDLFVNRNGTRVEESDTTNNDFGPLTVFIPEGDCTN
ncbi:MAG: S8 family serine peptidase [Trueperaceae bacterium]|nr:S8 family serine peptidase [Trueperaceae bacterium]